MWAVWKLGYLLAKMERGKPGPVGKDKSRPATYLNTEIYRAMRAREPLANDEVAK
jgi:hypothetical protein